MKSDCQHSLGWSAAKRCRELRGPFLRGGHDEPGLVQDAADRRGRGRGDALAGEVVRDGDRAGVQAVGVELFAQFDDPSRSASGVAREFDAGRRERGSSASKPAGLVAGDQGVEGLM